MSPAGEGPAPAARLSADHLLAVLSGIGDDLPAQVIEFLRELPVGIVITDSAGRAIHANPVAEELIGTRFHPDARPGEYATALHLFRSGGDEPYPVSELPSIRALSGVRSMADLELEHPERGRVRLRAFGAPLFGADGGVRFAIVAVVDVTAEMLLEEAVRERSIALERERLAEAIHDDVLQLLAAARLCTARLLDEPSGDPALAGRVDSALDAAVGKLRLILSGLRPALDGRSLGDALREALAPLAAEGVECTLDDRWAVAPDEFLTTTLRRVCEEAIANIRNHARPRRVTVRLDRDGLRLRVSIVDDGAGFSLGRGVHRGHFGLSLMRERIARIGGEIHIETAPGRGTAVRIWLPDPSRGAPLHAPRVA
jgi:signal transduction histidine kinase